MRYWYPLALVPIAAVLCPEPALLFTRCRRYAIQAGVILALLVFLRLATKPSLFFITAVVDGDVNDGGRGLSSQGATSVLVSLWLTYVCPAAVTLNEKLRRAALRFFLASAVVFSLQGTTGIAAGLTFVIFIAVAYRPLRLFGIVFLPLFALAAPLILPWLLTSVFGAQFIAHRLDNETTRKLIWAAFMGRYEAANLFTQLFGWPFGGMPTLMIHFRGVTRPWMASIHSMYIGGLQGLGFVGNAVLVCSMLALLVRFLNGFLKHDYRSYLIMAIIIITLLISFYSYEATAPIAAALLWPILAARVRPATRINRQPLT
jgi:O-antigen ligase